MIIIYCAKDAGRWPNLPSRMVKILMPAHADNPRLQPESGTHLNRLPSHMVSVSRADVYDLTDPGESAQRSKVAVAQSARASVEFLVRVLVPWQTRTPRSRLSGVGTIFPFVGHARIAQDEHDQIGKPGLRTDIVRQDQHTAPAGF